MEDLSVNLKQLSVSSTETELLNKLYQYFTEKGYRLGIGKSVPTSTRYEITGKTFPEETSVPVIVHKNGVIPDRYKDVVFCNSLEEIIESGLDFRNEFIIFTAELLAGMPQQESIN